MEAGLIERLLSYAGAVALCLVAATASVQADAVTDFYRGKTLSLIAGFPPGGGYDTYVRIVARHFGRFVPGEPAVVPSNMPGAGSLTAANHIYRNAAPDGLALAMFASSAAMEPLLGNKAALFDPTKFSWVGSMSNDVAYCGLWQGPACRRPSTRCSPRRRSSAAAPRPPLRSSTRWCLRTCLVRES